MFKDLGAYRLRRLRARVFCRIVLEFQSLWFEGLGFRAIPFMSQRGI